MICSNCGKELKDGAKFCGYCGTKIKEKKLKLSQNNSKNQKKKVIIICSLLIIIALIVAILLYINYQNRKNNKKNPSNISDESISNTAEDIVMYEWEGFGASEQELDTLNGAEINKKYEYILYDEKNRELVYQNGKGTMIYYQMYETIDKYTYKTYKLSSNMMLADPYSEEIKLFKTDEEGNILNEEIIRDEAIDYDEYKQLEEKYIKYIDENKDHRNINDIINNNKTNENVEDNKNNRIEIGRTYRYKDTYMSNGLTLGNDWSVKIIDDKNAYINFITYGSGDGISCPATYIVNGKQLEVTTNENLYTFTILDDGTIKYDFSGDIFK